MHEYPYYLISGDGFSEKGVYLEVRLQIGLAGGLPGAETEDDVIQALAGLIASMGANGVRVEKTDTSTQPVPVQS